MWAFFALYAELVWIISVGEHLTLTAQEVGSKREKMAVIAWHDCAKVKNAKIEKTLYNA